MQRIKHLTFISPYFMFTDGRQLDWPITMTFNHIMNHLFPNNCNKSEKMPYQYNRIFKVLHGSGIKPHRIQYKPITKSTKHQIIKSINLNIPEPVTTHYQTPFTL
jgi:UDP-2,3-diacylglucosamine pyrophosphatase LpxH